jgi:hypothetical protein
MVEQWVLGFLSGVGYGVGFIETKTNPAGNIDPLNGTDAQGALAWIDNYCHAHPLDQIEAASKAFVSAHPN